MDDAIVELTAVRRLTAQQLGARSFRHPSEVVAWLGAIQAQDYAATKWAVALRLDHRNPTDALIDEAISSGAVLRTHTLRGTWQLVTPADIRWILALVGPRVIKGSAGRHRELGLTTAVLRRGATALSRALSGGRHLTRAEVAASLEGAGVATDGQRLAHLLGWAELDGLICSGVRRGNQSTYALLDDRAPVVARRCPRHELVARLAERYFQSRGPATIHDFSWWSGLTVAEARAGVEAITSNLTADQYRETTHWRSSRPVPRSTSGAAHLLPAFDEYLVGYRDRDAVLDPKHASRHNAGGGMLNPAVVVGGAVIGTWRRVMSRAVVTVEVDLFERAAPETKAAIEAAAERYGSYLGRDPRLRWRR